MQVDSADVPMFKQMRGQEHATQAKAAQDGPTGNLVDDILAGASYDHPEADDLLGGELDEDLDDLDHLN